MEQGSMERIESDARQSKLLGRYAEARMLRAELERLHDQVGANLTEQVKNLNQLAFLAAACGEPAEAVRAAEKCLATYRRVPNGRDETLATYLMMLACVLAEAGRFCEAVLYGEESLSLFGRLYGEQSEFVEFRAKDVERMRQGEVRPYMDR